VAGGVENFAQVGAAERYSAAAGRCFGGE
jgi:hypothetical protein